MPGISGSDLYITPARSGLLRSGAGRADAPVLSGVVMPRYAQAAVARAGATRANYHSGKMFMTIAGVHVGTGPAVAGQGILHESLSIHDALFSEPTTASCRAYGFTPSVGDEVIVTLGSKNNPLREFGGYILQTTHTSLTSDPDTDCYDLSLIDYTWGLDKRKVTGYYTGSATTIAESLISTYASGYTASVVQGLATVDGGITFTNQDLTSALTQLCKRAGVNWFCDYDKIVRVFSSNTWDTNPTILNRVHFSLRDFSHERDLSQVVTRVYVEGGGVTAAATCAVGETILPLDGDPAWYDAAGGTVVSGPQRITYTGVTTGGGGGLVGTGAAPSGAPVVALASGAGIEDGAHTYAVTFVTGSGESLPSPLASVTHGDVTAPSAAPTAGTPTIGTGPDPGSHDYAVTFVTSAGETTASATVTRATTTTTAPASAPTPGTPTAGTGPDNGLHDYAVTFITSIGETEPSSISAGVTTGPLLAPTALTAGTATAGSGPDPGSHDYQVTFINTAGETTGGTTSNAVTTATFTPPTQPTLAAAAGLGLEPGEFWYAVTFVTATGETTVGAEQSVIVNYYSPGDPSTAQQVAVSNIATGPSGTTARKLYRTSIPGGHPLQLLTTISDNVTTTYRDSTPDSSLGAEPPVSNTALRCTVPLTAIPTGPSGVTSRKVYRRFNSSGAFKLVTTINNNTATTYTDTVTNASLGADAPASNTAAVNVVPLTAIPTGDANVTSRKLYRRSGGAGLKLLTTIANNTATTYTDTTLNASLGAAAPSSSTAYLQRIPLSAIPVSASPLVTARNIYRTVAGGSQLKYVGQIANNTATTYTDTVTDASLGANVPITNTAAANQSSLTAIAIGAASVTQRKVYRTVAGGAQLKLLTTIANNTATTYTDSTADASLGANVPTSDTSGLTQPQGNVLAGSTSLQVASIGPFASSGWAIIGNGQTVIRYTGVSGNTLTGIPASGAGAIVASIAYNSTVTQAPALTGIPSSGAGSILYSILRGADVNIWITVDDTAAQTALAALIGGDGIQEDVIQDRRLAKTEATNRGQAALDLRSEVQARIRFTTRDINTRAGKTIRVNLGAPYSLSSVDFLIQSVTQTFPAVAAGTHLPPLYTVEASSVRFTFEQLLFMMRT